MRQYIFWLLVYSLLAIVVAIGIVGFDNHPHSRMRKHRPVLAAKQDVKVYRVHSTNHLATIKKLGQVAQGVGEQLAGILAYDEDVDIMFWYVIFDQNTHNYYSASSETRVTSFSSLSWSRSATKPEELNESERVEELGSEQVDTESLGEAGAELSSDYSSIPESNSLDSMEGVPDSADSSSSDSSSDSGGDSGGDGGGE